MELPHARGRLRPFPVFKPSHHQESNFKTRTKREAISEYYALCNCTISDIVQEDKTDIETQFDEYWEDKKGETLLAQAEEVERKLEKRLIELECQEVTLQQELTRRHVNETSSQHQPSQTPEQSSTARGWAMERRLLGNELTIPPFYGNPSEFGPFWELFDELVHKQPYSNIEKLSILINCCKGGAARTLQMIPRTGESYDKAIAQLKNQYEDPRRITMQMIRQLKTMRQCREDPRSLRNNLSDVQAIIATLEKQGEVVNTTNMMSMVLDTFSKNMQDEMARKEFDSGKVWTMTDLLDNLNVAVKRREHVDSLKESNREERSVFHTSTTTTSFVRCTGCGQPHKFQYCDKYPSVAQKIERLRTINACWKCFSRNHHTQLCRKHNCAYCGGPHNLILCKKRQRQPNVGSGNSSRYRYTSPSRSEYGHPTRRYTRSRSYSPSGTFGNRSYSLDPPAFGSRDRAHVRNEQLQSRITPKISTRPSNDRGILKHDPEFPTRTSTQQEQRVRFQRSPSRRRRSLENVTVNFQTQSEEFPENHNEEVTSPFTKHEEVRLMIVPIQIGPTQSEEKETVFALLDSASDQSFITTSLAQRLNLEIYNETNIVVNTFGGKAEKRRVKRVVTPLYNSLGDYITVEFLTHEKITPPLRLGCMLPQDSFFIQEHFSEQEVQWISQVTNITVTPEILIGMDYFNTIMVLHEPVIRLPSGLFITPTFFGPVISGVPHEDNWRPEKDNFYEQIVHTYTAHNNSDRHLDISDLWKLPTIGIEDMSTEEEINKQIVDDFYSTVQIQDGKIYVRFPWKPNKASLSNNYNLALSRLHQLFKMKERNPQCWEEYCSIINDQLLKNFVEDAPRSQGADDRTPQYYIPHQAVIKSESATTKTRIVLDASSKMKGQLSLNDVIYQGPLILPNLCGILIRSRIGSKIMIADVEKAFHMIYLQETERDAVRFLWLKDVTQPPTQDNLRILRFCRLPFGINASPFLLGISIKYGIENQANLDKDLQQQLHDNLYVDNVLLTDVSTQSLIEKYRLCKEIFNNMSMNLRQFLTNDDVCNRTIASADLSTTKNTKILGIPWNHNSDSLAIPCKYVPTSTKRKVLQTTHSTFDPLGLLTPLLLPAKLFLQNLWKLDYKWDEPLSPNLDCEWQTICEQAEGYVATVPRSITEASAKNRCELHTFVDASARSFAAAVYLRTINESNSIGSSLLMARQRLAPINNKSKTLTIPRLELLALLIGVRLTHFILQEIQLPIEEIRIFSDSQVVLHWVQSNNKNGTFVDNRCNEIRTKIQKWSEDGMLCHLHYIPSETNPADCATKGLPQNKMTDHIWWSGPSFLRKPTSEWPKFLEFSWNQPEDPNDEKGKEHSHFVFKTNIEQVQQPHFSLLSNKFSSLGKYKRVLSLIFKFLKVYIYKKVSSEHQVKFKKAIPEIEAVGDSKPLATLDAADLSSAEKILIKTAQKTFSQQEFKKLDNLQLYNDEDGIIRCKGRIKTPQLSRETLEPILLPQKHPFTNLFVQDAHLRCGHQGVNGTLANIRLKYWIPKGRQVVKKYLKSCLKCKRWNARPYFYPNSPPLPRQRTQPSRPFSHVGIDLAGPFRVVNTDKKDLKRWIFLSTCMITRAVHLEVVNNLSGIEFINVLRRFIARRGKPQVIISDNATNFTLGREIVNILDNQEQTPDQKVQSFLANESIRWKFITPLSPWKGGFYERMIGVMKSIFKKVQKKSMQENEFATLVPECEAMINSRPLTYTGSTIEDSAVLRPIDFLIPHANVNFLSFNPKDKEDEEYIPQISTKDAAVQYFNNHLAYLQQLWKSWTDNYLLELRNFHQNRIKQKQFTRKQPYLGEVVLLMEENIPRGEWPLGLVTKLIEDTDGNVRSVELKTAKSKITRSINMLIPLEIEETKSIQDNCDDDESLKLSISEESTANTDKPTTYEDETTAQAHKCVEASPPENYEQRTRPFLPRRAKENQAYRVNVAQREIKYARNDRANASWHRWLLLALVATLCTSAHAMSNTERPIRCTKGGIIIQQPQIQDEMQVCANEYCLEIPHPDPNSRVQFPAEITLHTYQVTVKSLRGNSTQVFHWACPPSPFCEQITCTLCTPLITNPECWPRLAIALAAVLLYMVILTAYLTARALKRLIRCCIAVYRKLHNLGAYLLNKRTPTQQSKEIIPLLDIDNTTNRKWNTSTIVRILTITTLLSTTAFACQQTVVLPSSISQCNSRTNTCNNHTTIIAKFNAMQSELCLHLQHSDRQIYVMKISIQEIILRCQKETLYFTRNTQTQVQFRKRCPHMGTCSGLKCGKISPNTLVKELEVANNFTGLTYCSESCGGLGCSCGFPSSGCLFYRIYHVPVDKDIYEVFHCPSWYETIKLQLEQVNNQHNKKTYTGEIKPYTTQRFGATKVEVTAFSFSSNTILNKRFLTNKKTTAYLDDDTTFSYACTSNPLNTNSTHTCTIRDTCKCNPAEDSVSCYCTHNNISQIGHISKLLPIPISHGIVETGAKKLPMVRTTAFAVELAIHLDPKTMQLKQEVMDFNCNVVPTTITGCYNCIKGSVATIWCKTNVMQATAQVTCGMRQFVLACTKQGVKNEIRLFFNGAQVKEQCLVQCGIHTIVVELQGTLNYVNGMNPIWKYTKLWSNSTQEDGMFDIDWELPDIMHFLEICKTFYIYTVAVVAIFSCTILITATYLCKAKTKSARNLPSLSTSSPLLALLPCAGALLPFFALKRIVRLLILIARLPLWILMSTIKICHQIFTF